MEVDGLEHFICDVVDGIDVVLSSYISSTLLGCFVSRFTSTLIGSNVVIGCDVDTDESWNPSSLASRGLHELSLYAFLFGEIAGQDDGEHDIKDVEEVLLSKGVRGARS